MALVHQMDRYIGQMAGQTHLLFRRMFRPRMWRKIAQSELHWCRCQQHLSATIEDHLATSSTGWSTTPLAHRMICNQMSSGLNKESYQLHVLARCPTIGCSTWRRWRRESSSWRIGRGGIERQGLGVGGRWVNEVFLTYFFNYKKL